MHAMAHMLGNQEWSHPIFEALRCAQKGHVFVDSRSERGMQVCVRCRLRKPFEGLQPPPRSPEQD